MSNVVFDVDRCFASLAGNGVKGSREFANRFEY